MAHRKNKYDSGMTLIELMVVIAIIAILAVISTLSMDFIHKERVTSSIKEVASDLKKVRMDAMTAGPTTAAPNTRGMGIRFTSVSGYDLFTFNDCSGDYRYEVDGVRALSMIAQLGCPFSCGFCGGRESAFLRRVRNRLSGGSLVSPANALDDIIMFDRFGQARTSEWAMAAEGTPLILVIQHVSGLHGKCIRLDSNSIREGSWNGTSNTCTAN